MPRTRPAFALVAILVLAACTGTTQDATPTPEPTPEATPSATAEPTESPEASETPEESASESDGPTPSQVGGEPGGFTFESNAEADALFLDRFTCQNLDYGYEVDFPAEWNANAEFGDVPPCSWFAPTEYEAAGGEGDPPDEVAIEMRIIREDLTVTDAEVTDRAEGFIGVTQSAYRVTVTEDDVTGYYYVVQLGRSFDEGPNLVAYTTTRMGDDGDLNRAVLDRMMATMEFIGVIR